MDNNTQLYIRFTMGLTKAKTMETLLYVGTKEGLSYIAPFVEQQLFISVGKTYQTEVGEPQARAELSHRRANLTLILINNEQLDNWIEDKDLIGACRIHQLVDTDTDHDTALSRMSKREPRRRLKSLAEGFSFSASKTDADFFDFYRTMHQPTMNNRYGALARSVEEQIAHTELFQQGLLFKILKNQQWVAGSVCQINGDLRTLNARLLGVRDGDKVFRDNGAQNFIYHAVIEWACRAPDIDVIDFQGCEPFLTKGTFQYKKRFGARAALPNSPFDKLSLIMRVGNLTPAIRSFLIDNPSITTTDCGHLAARYFRDEYTQDRSDIPFQCQGLEHRMILDLDDWYA